MSVSAGTFPLMGTSRTDLVPRDDVDDVRPVRHRTPSVTSSPSGRGRRDEVTSEVVPGPWDEVGTRSINPWKRLAKLAHINILWHHEHEDDSYGLTNFQANTISLRRDLDQAGRRCSLLHELLHIHRGPVLDDPVLVEREELRVRKEAARLLLPSVRMMGEALAWAHTYAEAADELWVDEDTLLDRLDHLHPAERAYLKQRLADVDNLGGVG